MKITQQELRRVIYYRPETGDFYWRFGTKNRLPWRKAGTTNSGGYMVINIAGVVHYAHRLAVLYVSGSMPPVHTDHLDGDKSNNRYSNLAAKTASGNGHNRKRPNSNNTQGVLGVRKRGNRFRARVMLDRKEIFVGSFTTCDEAVAAHKCVKESL